MRRKPKRPLRRSRGPLAILSVAVVACGLVCLGLAYGTLAPGQALFLVAPVTAVTGTVLSLYAAGDTASVIATLGLALASIQAFLGLAM